MPPRKKTENDEVDEPSRRSIRIRDAPPKPEPVAAPLKKKKKTNKADPDLAEYKPTRKTAGKKRKKAEVEADDDEEAIDNKPKKKVKADNKPSGDSKPVSKAGKVADDEPSADAAKKIKVGDVLPKVTLKNNKGEDVSSADLTKGHGAVVFAFPKADTPGCTKQACAFRDNYAEFEKLGYSVYGLSADTGASQTKWAEKNQFQFPFLSDGKKELISALDIKAGASVKRSHFVFEKGTGKLLDAKVPVKPEDSYKLALEFVKSHK